MSAAHQSPFPLRDCYGQTWADRQGQNYPTLRPLTRTSPPFPDARPHWLERLFDRHPWACSISIMAALAVVCLAILGVMR